MKVAVVYQVNTAEADISQKSAKSVCRALESLKIEHFKVAFTEDFVHQIRLKKPTVVFNAMHGKYGEDGYLPSILNAIGVPYTHSGIVASQIGMNKILTDVYAQKCGIKTIPTQTMLKSELENFVAKEKCVVKPVCGGSSVATFIVDEGKPLSKIQLEEVESYIEGNLFLVQKFIKGREICVGILENKAIGTLEIKTQEDFFTYNAKYYSKETQYLCPAPVSEEVSKKMLKMAENLHNTIGAWCVSRVDFILQDEEIYMLEINTHPGFTETSLLPKIALQKGISYEEVVKTIVLNPLLEGIG